MAVKFFSTALLISFISLFHSSVPEDKTENAIYIKTQLIARGLVSPVGMACPNDGSGRLFILEQLGKVKMIKNGIVLPKVFLDVSKKIGGLNIAYSEKGLLGMAFHPGYKTNGRFFIYYTYPSKDKEHDNVCILAEYKISATSPDQADAASEKIIMTFAQPESNHNGGCIMFGPDSMMYIGLGDGGGGGDQHGEKGNGQDLNSLLGKVLRIDVDAKKPFSIPEDNPFQKQNAKPEIWAYGLRNPWRFSFDRATKKLFCGDVGQNKYEEVDIIDRGKNYGWRTMEGNHCYNPPENCDQTGLALPIYDYDHETGICVIGGYMYRGKSFPSLHGYYIYGDWSGKLFALKQQDDGNWINYKALLNGGKSNDIGAKINSFGEDENGEIYIITQNLYGPKSPTGKVYKIVL